MKRMIGWFVGNPVAANLLMTVFIVAGLITVFQIRQEDLPAIDIGVVDVTVPYPGAAPEEVESGIVLRIEEAIDGIRGVRRITSISREGLATVQAELETGADQIRLLNEIKNRVDAIFAFPADAEKPVVSLPTLLNRGLEIAVFGDADERALKELALALREDIVAIPGISHVETAYVRADEISIEVSEQTLRRYGLTFDEVADAVRRSSLDLPGGSIRSNAGEIMLRTQGQAYRGEDFRDIVVLSRADGTNVRLDEIATIVDGFQEGDTQARFDGLPAAILKIAQVGEEDIVEISENARAVVEEARTRMPAGVELAVWQDASEILKARTDILLRVASGGLALVLLLLALPLRFGLALWVAAGILIAMLGTLAAIGVLGIAISTLTVTGLILVLGIVVDDAIIVGERILHHERQGRSKAEAAVEGTAEVAVPVIFGAVTTMTAFVPPIFLPGAIGQTFSVLAYVVIICLICSLIESQLILPAHLAHRRDGASASKARGIEALFGKIQRKVTLGMEQIAKNRYGPTLERVLGWRYFTLAAGIGVLAITLSAVLSNRIGMQFMLPIEGDVIVAQLEMPEGIDVAETARAARQIEAAAAELKAELDAAYPELSGSLVQHIFTSVGQALGGRVLSVPQSHAAEVVLAMLPLRERGDISVDEIVERWRELTGPIYDSVALSFSTTGLTIGDPISIQLQGRSVEDLAAAATELRSELARIAGVTDISDSFRSGKQEVRLSLRPEGHRLGLSLNDLALQVRQAFYGEEVQRVQRGTEELRVMVRYPEAQRRSLGNLEDMRIRTADGAEIPFLVVADMSLGRGFSEIIRVDRQRVVTVRADTDHNTISPEAAIAALEADALPRVLSRYPGVDYLLTGEQEALRESMTGLLNLLPVAMLIIFALLAIPLRSYLQPLLILSVIPFGAVGAVVGHIVMGWPLVMPSILGLVALTGVVVNASLVLVDYVNRQRREGVELRTAVQRAAIERFRPIIITSTTTFAGLTPLMLNDNPATSFVVPIAISLAWGIVFATGITLFLVPCLYMILEDLAPTRPQASPMIAGAEHRTHNSISR